MSLARTDYIVGQVPSTPAELPVFIDRELQKVSSFIGLLSESISPELSVEPERPQNGQVAYADGVNWDPGSGRGLYIRVDTSWIPLFPATPPTGPNAWRYIDPRYYGVEMNNASAATDNTQAMQDAIAQSIFSGAPLYLPSGQLHIDGTLGHYENTPFSIIGDGYRQSFIVLTQSFSGDVISFGEMQFGGIQSETDTTLNFVTLQDGMRLEKFSIIGDRDATGVQNGIRFYDRMDNVLMRDVWVEYCKGIGISSGENLNNGAGTGYLRESQFYNVEVRSCGDGTTPAWLITSQGTSGDATNQLDFFGCKVVFPYGAGLVVQSESTLDTRRLRFFGSMIHGLPTPVGTGRDLININGNVFNVEMYGLACNACESGAYTVSIESGNGGQYPERIAMDISVTTGSGGGINIEGGRGHEINISSLSVSETDVNIGSAVDGPIEVRAVNELDLSMVVDSTVRKWLSSYSSRGDDDSPLHIRSNRFLIGVDSNDPTFIGSNAGTPEGTIASRAGTFIVNDSGSTSNDSGRAFIKYSGVTSSGYRPIQCIVDGNTAARPLTPTPYQMYFDTQLSLPIWYDDLNTQWIDAAGNVV